MDKLFAFGWTGVDLFFVLSGYLIAAPLFSDIAQAKGINLRSFFLKRVFRILPAYYTVLLLYFAVPGFSEFSNLSPLWKYLTFTQNFGLNLQRYHGFSHAWSLCVEEQFYLLFPLLLLLCLKWKGLSKAGWLLPAVFIAGIALRAWSWLHFVAPVQAAGGEDWLAYYQYGYYPTYNRLDGLLAGISIAALFQYKPAIRQALCAHGNKLLAAGLLLLVMAYLVCAATTSFTATVLGFPLVSLGWGVMVLASLCPGSVLYKMPARISAFIAAWSYAIYLSHKGIIHLVQQWLPAHGIAADSNTMLVCCTLACLLGAVVLRYAVEKPFLRLRNRFL